MLYAVLVDLTDQVAEVLHWPFSEISIEMVFRGLYHFTMDYHLGKASDPSNFWRKKPFRSALSGENVVLDRP